MSQEARDLTITPTKEYWRKESEVANDKTKRFLLRRSLKNKSVLVGGIIVLFFIFLTIFAPWLSPYDPLSMDIRHTFKPPCFIEKGTTAHILGTDELGRDLLSRLLYGMRLSFFISFCSVAIIVAIGSSVGILAGYFGGLTNTILMRLTDIQLAFPIIILAVAILSVLTPTVLTMILVLSLANWPVYARVTRGLAITERLKDYVAAAKVLGASSMRIILKYIVRNIGPSIIIVSILDLAGIVIWEAVLGFIGLSILPPTPTLGNIMGDGKNYMIMAWWISTLPGIIMFLLLFGLTLLADGLSAITGARGQRELAIA